MLENDIEDEVEQKPRKLIFKWFFPILYKPRKSMDEIVQKDHAVWLAPLLVLMVTALVLVLVSAPLIGQSAQPATQPENFEYYSPDQQQQYQDAVNMGASPLVTMVFPYVGKLIGIWVGWILLGSILHLSLTLNGSRSNIRTALNIVSWASVPFILRDIVQIIALLGTHQLITQPGLSGFVETGAGGFSSFLVALFTFFDLYLIWQVVLIGIGAMRISGIKAGNAWLATVIAVLIFLVIKALPIFIAAQLKGLSPTGMFF